jgi:hypothetical protein
MYLENNEIIYIGNCETIYLENSKTHFVLTFINVGVTREE